MEGIIWITSIKGSWTVRSSSIFLHFISSRSLRVAFAGTGTLGVYSRAGTGSGIGRTASTGCSGPGELVPTVGSLSFSAAGLAECSGVSASEVDCYAVGLEHRINWFVLLRPKKLWIVPHVRVWVVVFEMPSLPIHVVHLLLIVS
ncbi:hypothetical protein DY000_02038840 [Brassica cretica]|uniref:Uncharacterized protein n=1 Tax=Brassica cretica TaxID=69181 RepID=A0ABQ7BAQ2_BRACR|nr:hypothetical protein DY000_02038840 [Brassica cretica]